MMRVSSLGFSFLFACAFISAGGIAGAGETIVEPVDPPLVIPLTLPAGAIGGGAAPGSPQAIAAAVAAMNTLALQLTAQGVPPLTAQQKAYALAKVRALLSRVGPAPELQSLLAAIENAPIAAAQ